MKIIAYIAANPLCYSKWSCGGVEIGGVAPIVCCYDSSDLSASYKKNRGGRKMSQLLRAEVLDK